MAILFGTTGDGTTLPVLVDQYGNLLAKGIPGDEGPPGPPGGAFALPPNPVDGDVLGWENGQLVWNPTPPLPSGTYGPFVYFDNGSNLVVPQTPTLSSGELLFMSDADGNIAYYTPTTSAISSVVVVPGSWTSATETEANGWLSVTYGDDKFVAVAYSGTNRVMYSANGINWTAASAAEANEWYSVTYGDGKFVAVSGSGTNRVMYSANGINWTAAAAAETNSWRSVTYGDGKFVAVSASGTNRVMYSANGINWTAASATEANGWAAVTYGDGKFVAVAYTGTNRVMYSANGINWTAASATEANVWSAVTYGDGKFVAVAANGTNRVMYSADGINWTAALAAVANGWYSVIYGDDKFVAVADNGTNRVMYDSTGAGASETELEFISPNPDLQYFQVGEVVDTSGTKVTSIDLSANKMGVDGGTWTVGESVVSSTDISGTGSVDAVVGDRIDLQANNQQWINGYYVTVQALLIRS
jgi:hypothetical protein